MTLIQTLSTTDGAQISEDRPMCCQHVSSLLPEPKDPEHVVEATHEGERAAAVSTGARMGR